MTTEKACFLDYDMNLGFRSKAEYGMLREKACLLWDSGI